MATASIDFTKFKALTFDCYGTLIDWERGILSVLRPWADKHPSTKALSDNELLAAFSKAENDLETANPSQIYSELLKETLRVIAKEYGRESSKEEESELAESVGKWPPFSDTIEALKRLKRHYKLVIVSNVDR